MKQFSLTSVLCLIASVAAVLAMAVANFSSQLYKQATSPDGSWSVQVHRCQTFPMFNVDVIVTALLESGTVLFNDRIDRRDLWEDVDERYPDVICENDEIRLGPGYRNTIRTEAPFSMANSMGTLSGDLIVEHTNG